MGIRFKLVGTLVLLVAMVWYHNSAVVQAREDGRNEIRVVNSKDLQEHLDNALGEAEVIWKQDNTIVRTVIQTEIEIREVINEVIREVEVPINTCTDLGTEWLHRYNRIITAPGHIGGAGEDPTESTDSLPTPNAI